MSNTQPIETTTNDVVLSDVSAFDQTQPFTNKHLPTKLNNVPEISQKRITKARIDILRHFPFVGYMLTTTDIFFTEDVPTMAATTIPNNTIYINPKFSDEDLTAKHRVFILMHELMHIYLDHLGRQSQHAYHPELWNVATDFCINSFLVRIKSDCMEMPEFGLFDERFEKMSSDQIYHKLLEEFDQDASDASFAYGGDGDCNADQACNGTVYGKRGQQALDRVSKETVSSTTAAQNKQVMAASVANGGKVAGAGENDLVRLFSGLLKPQIPWTDVLKDYMENTAKTHYTYARVSRRSDGTVVFPTMTGNHIDLVFGVDTSGSMGDDDIKESLTELKGILDNFDSWKLSLLSCDERAHLIGEYVSEDGDIFDDIDLNLIGGGGTDMAHMVDYANEMEDVPAICIILTDGHIPIKSMEVAVCDIPTLVVVTSEGNKDLELQRSTVIHIKK